jgi:hypothetical protein
MESEVNSELVKKLDQRFNQMVNEQFKTPEVQRYYSMPLTWKRALFREQQRMPYILSRRSCWAYVQAKAPLDVKQIIWRHEQDELIFDERANSDHFTLAQRQARDLGVPEADIVNSEAPPAIRRRCMHTSIWCKTSRGWGRYPPVIFSSGATTVAR